MKFIDNFICVIAEIVVLKCVFGECWCCITFLLFFFVEIAISAITVAIIIRICIPTVIVGIVAVIVTTVTTTTTIVVVVVVLISREICLLPIVPAFIRIKTV